MGYFAVPRPVRALVIDYFVAFEKMIVPHALCTVLSRPHEEHYMRARVDAWASGRQRRPNVMLREAKRDQH